MRIAEGELRSERPEVPRSSESGLSRIEAQLIAALCPRLDVARPMLVRIRARSQAIGAWLLQRMADISDLSIAELRCLMGDQRVRLRVATGMRRKAGGG